MSSAARHSPIEDAIESAVRRALEEPLRRLDAALARLSPAPADALLPLSDAALLLGFSERVLRQKAKDGKVPAVKAPGSREWRFRRSDLMAILAGSPAKPRPLDTDAQAREIVAHLRRR